MKKMSNDFKEIIAGHLAAAKGARLRADWIECWQLLDDAHILSQPCIWPHVRVHGSMLVTGWKARDVHEVRGQLLRLLAGGPASAGDIPSATPGDQASQQSSRCPSDQISQRYSCKRDYRLHDVVVAISGSTSTMKRVSINRRTLS